jgi:MFS family permease
MWWLILSGALHNFNMYAIGSYLSPFLQRYHGLSTSQAGWISGAVYGCFGGMGLVLGGWACDRVASRRIRGRLEVCTLAIAGGTPCIFLALGQPPGSVWAFAAWMLPGCMLGYVYYPGVYSTIQDIVEPTVRGTAMAVYFFAMYLLGGAVGPVIVGRISDYYFAQALPPDATLAQREAAKAIGLYHAMYIIPALGLALIVVLLIASRTVKKDYDQLQQWVTARS